MNKNLYKVAIAWVLAITFFTVVFPSMTQETSQTGANKETLIAFSEAEAARDYELLSTYLTEDFVRHSVATEAAMPDMAITSRDAYVSFLQGTAAAFPDYVTEPVMLVAEGNYVTFYSMFTGSSAETGMRIQIPVIGVVRFKNGLMAEMWVEWDNLDWDMQMNTTETPVTSVDDLVGAWETDVNGVKLRMEFTDAGELFAGISDTQYKYYAGGTFEVNGNQIIEHDTEYVCDAVYDVFVGYRPDGKKHHLRFELVGDDCYPDRKAAQDGQIVYPW